MGEVINFPVQVHLYGGCPHCRKHDGYLNIGREHWFVCKKHKTKWYCRGQFTDMKYETPEGWDRNTEYLKNYQEVEPIY